MSAAFRVYPEELPNEPELVVLGCLLRSPEFVGEVSAALKPSDFYHAPHQDIYTAILILADRGDPIAVDSVWECLRLEGTIAAAGEQGIYLAELLRAGAVGASVSYYVQRIKAESIRRQLINAGKRIAAHAEHASANADEILVEAEREILAIGQAGLSGTGVPVSDAVSEAFDRYDTVASLGAGEVTGVPTGLLDLDTVTTGLHPGELILIAARPSVGKTTLALCLACNAAVKRGVPVFFASLEQNKGELAERLICIQGKINGQKLRKGMLGEDERTRMSYAGAAIRKAPLWIDDCSGQSVSRIAGNARRYKAKHGVGLIIIDYLGLIEPENRGKVNREQEVALISRRLKGLAKELKVPVVCLAQLNRQAEMRGKPKLCDLRDSGAQEQDADVVFLLHDPPDSPSMLEIIVAKQRNGPRDTVRVTFIRESFLLANYIPVPE